MRIVHISDLHFVDNRAKAKEMAKRMPFVLVGAAPSLVSRLLKKRSGNPTDKENLNWPLLASPAIDMAFSTLRPIFAHWKDHAKGRDLLAESVKRDAPDLVVVTGDFATLASSAEFVSARAYVHRLEGLVGRGRVLILPGNHDTPLPLFKNPRRSQDPSVKLKGYLHQFGAFHPGTHPFPSVRVEGEVCGIAIDSVEPSYPINSDGRVTQDQLDRANDIVNGPVARGSFKVLCLHHPPVEKSGRPILSLENPHITGPLTNRDQVMNWAKEVKIDLILCGHDHHMYVVQEEGAPPVYCAGSTPKLIHEKQDVSYKVFKLESGRMTVEERRVESDLTFASTHLEVPA